MTLAAIERYLRQLPPGLTPHDLALQRAVVASWAPDAVETVTREELERRAGRPLGEEEVDRLVAMGVVERDGEGLRVDPGLLRLGVELLDVPLSAGVDPRRAQRPDRALARGGPRAVTAVPRRGGANAIRRP